MLEITGYDHTNRRGFKKLVFETKKGTDIITKNAEVANTLVQDDWVEITMDDTSYKNVQSIKKIAQPAGGDVPSQAGGAPASGDGGSKAAPAKKMSKEEWAAKDAKIALNEARAAALLSAVELVSSEEKSITKSAIAAVEKLANRFTSFLLNGSFEGKPETPAPPEQPTTREPGDDQGTGDSPPDADSSPGPEDDDIPF
jgi:hypothetical protein